MTNLLYSAKHYQTKCAEDRKIVEDLKNDAEILLKNVQDVAKSAVNGNIGDIRYTVRTEVPYGGFWCDGSLIQQNDLPTIYDMLLQQKLHSVDINTYNNVVNLNGSCGFFGLDTVNKSFKLPLLRDVYIKAGQVADEFGAESLPNIKGTLNTGYLITLKSGDNSSGCISTPYTTTASKYGGSNPDSSWGGGFAIDASLSSSIYQDGAKVNPDHVKYRAYIILFSGEKEQSIVNWTNQLEKKTNESIAQIDAKANSYLDKTQITKCLIEIPQDIKLELVEGMTKLKTNSKVYFPKGANGFNSIIVTNDIISNQTLWGAGKYFVIVSGGKYVNFILASTMFSGETQPTPSQGHWWYDTLNNKIKTSDGTSWVEQETSLPIALVTSTNGTNVASIDQVFNGFGYIGSTHFILPGIKGLMPDGRNADGSLRNIEFVNDKVAIGTYAAASNNIVITVNTSSQISTAASLVESETEPSGSYILWYKPSENILRYKSTSTFSKTKNLPYGIFSSTATRITSLNHKLPFKAIDYNDKETIVSWGIPDYSAIISVSSGFTAPSDGMLSITYNHGDWANNSLTINSVTIFSVSSTASYYQGTRSADFYPLSKGDVVSWTNGGGKFIPFKGAK